MDTKVVRKHHKKYEAKRKGLRNFITRAEKVLTRKHAPLVAEAEEYAWTQVDCLSCANCCKTMSPTYTQSDIKRISKHLEMTPAQFKKKWLYFDKENKDWMNVSRPCQFLDLKTNKCKIYAVRPADCAGFPHLNKQAYKDYFYIHKQNIEYCPATLAMVERLKESMEAK